MKRLVVGLVLILFPFIRGTAQDNGLPPVIVPVFMDTVSMVETLPIVNVDQSARVIYSFNPASQTWTVLPFPLELGQVSTITERTNGTYLISMFDSKAGVDSLYGAEVLPPQEVWVFDPAAGMFSHPEGACGQVKALPGEGIWRLYQNPDTAQWHLCFTETGAASIVLPDELQPTLTYALDKPASLSPSGEWVVFSDGGWNMYAAELATGRVNLLGSISAGYGWVNVVRWADALHPIIFNDPQFNNLTRFAYSADVTQPNSLTPFSDEPFCMPEYADDPPRYEWTRGYCPDEPYTTPEDIRCRIHVFSLTTFEEAIYPYIPGVCGPGRIIPDGSGDRLNAWTSYSSNLQSANLIRFNPQTGYSRALLGGWPMQLKGLTSDGRYAVLAVAETVTFPRDDGQLPTDADSMVTPYAAIFDLQKNEIRYRMYGSCYLAGSFIGPDVLIVDTNTFLFADSCGDNALIEVTDHDVNETLLDGSVLFLRQPGSSVVGVQPDTFIFTPVMEKPIQIVTTVDDQFSWEIIWQKDDLLQVSLIDRTRPSHFVAGSWLVQVP